MKKFLILAMFALPVALSSCLKDKFREDRIYGMEGVSDIKLVELFGSPEYINTLSLSATNTTINLVRVHLATAAPADAPVTVTLVRNDALATAAGYTLPPAGSVTPSSLTVTIPAGSRDGYVTAVVNTSVLLADTYALGFQIASVSTPGYVVSINYDDVVVVLPIANAYEGNYSCTGLRTRYNGPTLASGVLDNFPFADFIKHFSTVNVNTINGNIADAGSGVNADLTINADNTVTIKGLVGVTPAGGNINRPGQPSTYDPATKTFNLHVFYLNAAGNLRTADEVMVKQ